MTRKHEEHPLDGGATRGYKEDLGKARMELLPPDALVAAAEVFTYGAKKYASSDRADENNWTEGMLWGRMYGALQRHLQAFWAGEDVDPESGMHHLSHALCCALMLHEYGTNEAYAHLDDRFKGSPKMPPGGEAAAFTPEFPDRPVVPRYDAGFGEAVGETLRHIENHPPFSASVLHPAFSIYDPGPKVEHVARTATYYADSGSIEAEVYGVIQANHRGDPVTWRHGEQPWGKASIDGMEPLEDEPGWYRYTLSVIE